METLFAPWRYSYISVSTSPQDCFFCEAAKRLDDAERLVVARTGHHLVLLNRHPYTNGHLMIAPLDHVGDPEQSSVEARAEFWPVVLQAQRAVREVYSPDGFNLGMNLGSAAGAGVPEHFHFHLVPRWSGDTNFMTSIAEVRVSPEDLLEVAEKLRPSFEAQRAGNG